MPPETLHSTRKLALLVACPLLTAAVFTQSAPAANLILNGTFSNLSYSGSEPVTTLFGQFGSHSGSTITVDDWVTSGYNFVYAPYTPTGSTTALSTADSGTTANGANSGAPNQAPGQYNTSAGFGDTYLWGANNGGINTIPATDPEGNSFLAADGAFEVSAITQTINNLTVGQAYAVQFYWAAAQQQGFSMATTEQWKVSLGSETHSTSVFNLPAKGFSGWMAQTLDFTANSTSEALSFLAAGTPNGQPPFLLLGTVTMDTVPEPSVWLFCFVFGTLCVLAGVIRRRRAASACDSGLKQASSPQP